MAKTNWQDRLTHLQDQVQTLRQERAHLDLTTERLKQDLRSLGEQADENAFTIAEYGLTIGDKDQHLFTGGAGDWQAPKMHPVWASEIADEVRQLERMGAATFEYEPQQRQLEVWDAARAQLDALTQGTDDRQHQHGYDRSQGIGY
jgi:hypothetical protein